MPKEPGKHFNFIFPASATEVVIADIETLNGIKITDYFRIGSTIVHGLIEGKFELHSPDGAIVHLVFDGRDGLFELGSVTETAEPPVSDPDL